MKMKAVELLWGLAFVPSILITIDMKNEYMGLLVFVAWLLFPFYYTEISKRMD